MDRLKSPLQAELPWNVRVGITCSIAVATSVYLHALPRYTKPALLRWCLGLPVLVINLWLPLLFDSYEELLTRTSVVFMLAWLGSFKVSRSSSQGAMWRSDCSTRLQTRPTVLYIAYRYLCIYMASSCVTVTVVHADAGAVHEQGAPPWYTDPGSDSSIVPAACLSQAR